MSHPSRWLAVLRILLGLWFLKALLTKLEFTLLGGIVPWMETQQRWIDLMPVILGKQMEANPFPWYKAFVEQTVLPNVGLFASLTAWGEVLVGLSLVSGLFAGLGALGGLWLSINYGIAGSHTSSASEGFHYLLVAVFVVLFLARSGRAWGLDSWVAWRWPGSVLTWRPFA
jgi:thiosulfate dehydrogenase [quinone] large subunit